MRTLVFSTCLALTFMSASCGVSIEARRVAQGTADAPLGPVIAGEGIAYALPRTEFQVIQPVTITVPPPEQITQAFAECKAACQGDPSTEAAACKFKIASRLEYQTPRVATVTAPDPNRVYQMLASTGLLRSMELSASVSESGVLSEADASMKNNSYAVVAATIKTGLGLVGLKSSALFSSAPRLISSRSDRSVIALAPAQTLTPPPAKAPAKRSCYVVSRDVADLTRKAHASTGANLSCSLVGEVDACLKPYDDKLAQSAQSLDALYTKAQSTKIDPKVFEQLVVRQTLQVSSALEDRKAAAADFGLTELKATKASYEVRLPVGGPQEFVSMVMPDRTLKSEIAAGNASIAALSDQTPDLAQALLDILSNEERTYVVRSDVPPGVGSGKAIEEELGSGYRYRLPIMSPVTLDVFDDAARTTRTYPPIVDRKLVAQYGPIAALPATFHGKGGKVGIKLWPDSGGLRAVEIGTESIPPETFTDVIGTAATEYKTAVQSRAQARKDAAARDLEMEALTRQRDLLNLRKEIRELQDQTAP